MPLSYPTKFSNRDTTASGSKSEDDGAFTVKRVEIASNMEMWKRTGISKAVFITKRKQKHTGIYGHYYQTFTFRPWSKALSTLVKKPFRLRRKRIRPKGKKVYDQAV